MKITTANIGECYRKPTAPFLVRGRSSGNIYLVNKYDKAIVLFLGKNSNNYIGEYFDYQDEDKYEILPRDFSITLTQE